MPFLLSAIDTVNAKIKADKYFSLFIFKVLETKYIKIKNSLLNQ